MDAVCKDFEASPLSAKEKALFRYLAKVNDVPAKITQSDVDVVKKAGWTEAAIYDAATVCAMFNFFNRWIDATGVADVPPDLYEKRLAMNGDTGYSL